MADIFQTWLHDPDALLDYSVDWSRWLVSGDTIASVSWTVPSGITNDHTSNTTSRATIWLTGGTPGKSYQITCHVVTAAGREDDRTFQITVVER